jgi:putative flavoprotein involved in K+ transport
MWFSSLPANSILDTADVVIVGAGQAGLALSYRLTHANVDHIILERGRIANSWAEERWDSFCLVTPNWTITLPGAMYDGPDPDGFMPRDEFVAYMRRWAEGFGAPVREGVNVTRISADDEFFCVETDKGAIRAKGVVVATATHQMPRDLGLTEGVPEDIVTLPAPEYRNPNALRPGAVLVLGSGQTGCQIAEEARLAGREVYLSVGSTGRLPRCYRGRDCIEWQLEMGWLDRTPDMLANAAMRFRGDPHLTGAGGGRTLSLHDLHRHGVILLGHTMGVEDGDLRLADDLMRSVQAADQYAADYRAAVDAHIAANALSCPVATEVEMTGEAPDKAPPFAKLDRLGLRASGIRTIIDATGFRFDFSWVDFPVLDAAGYPATDRGVTTVPGLYFMGLNWMYKRKSGIIYGVEEDATHLAECIRGDILGP